MLHYLFGFIGLYRNGLQVANALEGSIVILCISICSGESSTEFLSVAQQIRRYLQLQLPGTDTNQ